MKYCFKVGLYKQGLLHDLSKYTWVEFSAGIKYYKGYMSPNGIQKKVEGLSTAWLHHKGRNKHHFEYWIDYGINPEEGIKGMKMPVKYVVEMFIDRMSASMNYQKEKYTDKSPLEYYDKRKEYYLLHETTRKQLEFLLNKLAKDGEKETLRFIKKEVLKEGFLDEI
ncbi:MAG: DUF5662 family protein [Clostridium sp.]|nr:DUF5662 family protein [Clostridium sp.]MCI7441969.1 DUF5662 family protein [Clostridium sp.]